MEYDEEEESKGDASSEDTKDLESDSESESGCQDLEEKDEHGNTRKRTHLSPTPTRRLTSHHHQHHNLLSKAKAGKEPGQGSNATRRVKQFSPAAYKFYMEQHIENLFKTRSQREGRRMKLESELMTSDFNDGDKEVLRRILYQKESNHNRLRRAKMDRSMFTKIRPIGVGAFGEVALVRKIDTDQLYAMKTLRKADVLKRNQVAHVKAERDILAEADNEWVVKLYFSFQDEQHLYFVMDYIPGGDLMSLLIKLNLFDEDLAR